MIRNEKPSYPSPIFAGDTDDSSFDPDISDEISLDSGCDDNTDFSEGVKGLQGVVDDVHGWGSDDDSIFLMDSPQSANHFAKGLMACRGESYPMEGVETWVIQNYSDSNVTLLNGNPSSFPDDGQAGYLVLQYGNVVYDTNWPDNDDIYYWLTVRSVFKSMIDEAA